MGWVTYARRLNPVPMIEVRKPFAMGCRCCPDLVDPINLHFPGKDPVPRMASRPINRISLAALLQQPGLFLEP